MRERVYLYDAIASNRRYIAAGVFVFFAVIFLEALVVAAITRPEGAFAWRPFLMALAAAFGSTLLLLPLLALWAYFKGKSSMLKLFWIVPTSEADAKKLDHALKNVCLGMGVAEPDIRVIGTGGVNAISLARGYKEGLILVTRGAVENLDRDELEALLAHEMFHIQSHDTWLWMLGLGISAFLPLVFSIYWGGVGKLLEEDNIAYTMAFARYAILGTLIFTISWLILAAFWIPLWIAYFTLAIPRNRDYLADSEAVLCTRNPEAVLSAVEKSDIMRSDPVRLGTVFVNHMFFNQPLEPPRTFTRWITDIFNTHPRCDKRVERIRSLG